MILFQTSDERGKNDSCTRRIPFGCILATTIILAASVAFVVASPKAIDVTFEQTFVIRSLLGSSFHIQNVRLLYCFIGCSIAVFAAVLLIYACIINGTNRKKLIKKIRAWIIGKITTAVFFLIAYFAYLIWTALFTIVVFFGSMSFIIATICRARNLYADKECFDLSSLSSLIRLENQNTPLLLCGSSVAEFCELNGDASYWHFISYIATVLVLLGIVHWLICLTAQYARYDCRIQQQPQMSRQRDECRQPLHQSSIDYKNELAMNQHISSHPSQRGLMRASAR